MTPDPEYLLDASALLAAILNEAGGNQVDALMPSAAISAVNLTEVITKLLKRVASPDHVLPILKYLSLPVIAWDESSAHFSLQFAHLANQGFSLGDRACITEAMRRPHTKILTADKAWKDVPAISKRVVLIR